MQIVQAESRDLPRILEIYRQARDYMCRHGNPRQWTGGYPSEALIQADIAGGNCFLCREELQILGVFSCLEGPDPTYARIDQGRWLGNGPYSVIHRVAVAVHCRGVASACLAYGLARHGDLRIDTHRDNTPMQRALEKNGFMQCGVIYLEDGSPRLAYEKKI